VAWIASFAVVFTLIMVRSYGSSAGSSAQSLELEEGIQRQGIHWKGSRVGAVVTSIHRRQGGWSVHNRFLVKGRQAAVTHLTLYRDLSMSGIKMDADLSHLAELGGVSSMLFRMLGERGRIHVRGGCEFKTGVCKVKGKIAGREVDLPIHAGRGPVLTSAIYPLLARGSLGKQAELSLFDPLSLKRKVVTFRVEAREQITLRKGIRLEAVRVKRQMQGVSSLLWIDPNGRVLREELPLGIVFEHESYVKGTGQGRAP
jgi:hypothetical protein